MACSSSRFLRRSRNSSIAVANRRLRDTFMRRARPWAWRKRPPSREIAVFTVDELIPLLLPEF